jgi:hypothetical protein
VELFVRHGAAGVIGTQCEVKNLLAADLAVRFFGRFLGRASAGAALFAARRALLDEGDPRGLAYSLFASADIHLARPILEEPPSRPPALPDRFLTSSWRRRWRSLLHLVFLLAIPLFGLAAIYVAAPTFGRGGFIDYLNVAVWGFAAQFSQQALASFARKA